MHKQVSIRTQSQMALYEAFTLFQYENRRIKKNELGNVLRVCGKNPTNAEICELLKIYENNENDFLEIEQVEECLYHDFTTCENPDIVDHLKFLENEKTGKVKVCELLFCLSNFGENINMNELKEILHPIISNCEMIKTENLAVELNISKID